MMAEMLGGYSAGESSSKEVQEKLGSLPGYKNASDPAEASVADPEPAASTGEATVTPPKECPASDMVQDDGTLKKPPAECPASAMAMFTEKSAPEWTEGGDQKVEEAKQRMADVEKFEGDRAEQLARGVAEERATEKNMEAISEAFMTKLGKQLGYGHPLAQVTAEHTFEWTPEAEERLKEVPEFCREMSRWRVEWTAVKLDLGRVITPEIMDKKYEMWGEVSEAYMDREGKKLEWADDAWKRVENIPSFVLGQVLESVEGNAERWGVDVVTSEVLDKVIQKWIDTGDFHEAQFGYK